MDGGVSILTLVVNDAADVHQFFDDELVDGTRFCAVSTGRAENWFSNHSVTVLTSHGR
jgi:hypothetical protein